ncbi:hypothetical protein TH9_12325 [Thalassospira xiamenensis]|uniref:hypothetical protein n=1 Tax=Thalassospira xiamenensis TaxID=220697 RepID=UPI000DEDB5FA|nr:hypothetical protein [Thalassospira xiamenensis]RCK32507.1 hypothetical protein TH9_12325 [Thalassospira xiamenensis]
MIGLQPITYVLAGKTPVNWCDLTVIDNGTGREVRFVQEVNTVEGWLRRLVVLPDGSFAKVDGRRVFETIYGDFRIEQKASERRQWQGCRLTRENERGRAW